MVYILRGKCLLFKCLRYKCLMLKCLKFYFDLLNSVHLSCFARIFDFTPLTQNISRKGAIPIFGSKGDFLTTHHSQLTTHSSQPTPHPSQLLPPRFDNSTPSGLSTKTLMSRRLHQADVRPSSREFA